MPSHLAPSQPSAVQVRLELSAILRKLNNRLLLTRIKVFNLAVRGRSFRTIFVERMSLCVHSERTEGVYGC
jgi:hypothetical protein